MFTADTGRYALSNGVMPPQITVTVAEEIEDEETETRQEELDPCTKTEGCTLREGHEGGCVLLPPANGSLAKTITHWTFADGDNLNGGELPLPGVNRKHQAEFDTVVSMLPTQILSEIEDEAAPALVDITGWTCDTYRLDSGSWPVLGEYLFIAVLPEGYICDPLPSVKVTLGGADMLVLNNTITEGHITVTASKGGEVTYTLSLIHI